MLRRRSAGPAGFCRAGARLVACTKSEPGFICPAARTLSLIDAAMLLFRWTMMLLLLSAAVCFVFWVGTGRPHYKRWGLQVLKWTMIAAFGFFAVLILERVA